MDRFRFRYPVSAVLWACLAAFAAAFLAACDQEKSEAGPAAADRRIAVATAAVETGKIQEVVNAVGTLEAAEAVEIRPEINGIVEAVHFAEGAAVSTGDPLFSLESEEIRRRLQSLRARLDGAVAQAERAQRFYERRRELFARKVISAETRDKALADYLSAEARVDQLEAQILETREILEKTRLLSPIEGLAGEHRVDEGDYASVGDLLTTVFNIDRISLSFTVSERFSGRVKTGQAARIALPSHPDKTFRGTVYYISPQILETTRNLPVKAWVQNPERKLLPGAFASVELVVETRSEALLIPEEALVPTREGYGVFVVKDGKARWRPVALGLRRPGTVEIRRGLAAEEAVVRTGHINLTDGAAVRVVPGQ